MKSLCFVLLLALSMPGCMFSKTSRSERAYNKYVKQSMVAREKRQKQLIKHQRAEMPSLRNTPPPVEQQTVQQTPAPESQE